MDQKYSDHADSSNDFQGTVARYNWSVTDTNLLLSSLEHCVAQGMSYNRCFTKVSNTLQEHHIPVNAEQVLNKWKYIQRRPNPIYIPHIQRIKNLQKKVRSKQTGEPVLDDVPYVKTEPNFEDQRTWPKQDLDTMLQIFSVNLPFLSTLEETEMFNTLSRELAARGLVVAACDVQTQWLQLLKKKDQLSTEDYELVHNIQTLIDRKKQEREAQSNDPLEEDSKQGIAMLMDESEHESECPEETHLAQSFARYTEPDAVTQLLEFLKQKEMNQQKRHDEMVALKKRQIELFEQLLKR